jgi:hypothetical protein
MQAVLVIYFYRPRGHSDRSWIAQYYSTQKEIPCCCRQRKCCPRFDIPPFSTECSVDLVQFSKWNKDCVYSVYGLNRDLTFNAPTSIPLPPLLLILPVTRNTEARSHDLNVVINIEAECWNPFWGSSLSSHMNYVLQQLMQLVVDFSPWRTEFNPTVVHVWFVISKTASQFPIMCPFSPDKYPSTNCPYNLYDQGLKNRLIWSNNMKGLSLTPQLKLIFRWNQF